MHENANSPNMPDIPISPELISYVEAGRNPDIYTREFVELARKGNQLMRGKAESFGSFTDILARAIAAGNPELKEDVKTVLRATGRPELRENQGEGSGGNTN
jgi:mediator of RNA polymerase II transcription subunit 10